MRLWLALIFPALLAAQTAPAPPAPDPAKREAILRILKATKAGEMSVQMVKESIEAQRKAMPQVPEAFWTEFLKAMTPEAFESLALPIYDKHFSLDELKAILAFYETPAGRALLAKLPLVMQESMEAGKALGARVGGEIAERLKQEGKL